MSAYIIWRRYILESEYRFKVTLPELVSVLQDSNLIQTRITAGGIQCDEQVKLNKPIVFMALTEYLARPWYSRWLYSFKAARAWAHLKSSIIDGNQ